jgi:single-strand DNA-binding protein
MTGTFSKTLIIGHLGANPDIHTTGDGREIARFTVATNARFTDRNGDKQERTEWHRVVIFAEGLISGVVKPYLKKGTAVLIEGSNRTEKYTDKDGREHYGTDIVGESLTLIGNAPKAD